MARLSIVCALAAAAVALAAFSSQALKTNKFHVSAIPFRCIHFVNRHMPSSTISKKHAHHTVPLPGGIKHTPQAAAPSPAIYQAYALPPEPFLGFYSCLEKLTEKCGVEICRGIFGTGGGCHKGLLKTALALPEVAKFDKKKIQAIDVEISSNCVLITNLKGKSSSPILP
ncbi:hypothetical protein Salat_1118100 [Sesamum alatum]|uniref:Prolamin-like domain-containing protein n=1 Tax=Sesamum alatum TaxID=300844 RepID=A0AAE1YPU0_9LAMI|nr:hypothetical protein Salat_1118100 [Sesamum alatum]